MHIADLNLHTICAIFIPEKPLRSFQTFQFGAGTVNWQDLGYIYEKKITIEVHRVNFVAKSRIFHQYCVFISIGMRVLQKIKMMIMELGKQSFLFRGPMI